VSSGTNMTKCCEFSRYLLLGFYTRRLSNPNFTVLQMEQLLFVSSLSFKEREMLLLLMLFSFLTAFNDFSFLTAFNAFSFLTAFNDFSFFFRDRKFLPINL
jgi:hypothetical protein